MANIERIKLWIEALESGEYIQGQNVLHRVDDGRHTYCCLGVACEIAIQNGLELYKSSGAGVFSYGDLYNQTDLPRLVIDWFEFSDEDLSNGDGDIILDDDLTTIGANDVVGLSFGKIAQKLREKFNISREG